LAHPLRLLRRVLRKGLEPLRDQRPASRLIRLTARKEWRLISLNLLCNLLQAAAEGATLGVMFLAVDLLSKPQGTSINWSSKPLLGSVPQLADLLNSLPRNQLFLILLGLAVLLKVGQGLAMYVGSVAVGFYANRTSARLTSMLHSQVLGFSFPCASRYRVGDLQYINGSGPGTVIGEINIVSALVLNLLMLITYLVVLINLSPWLLVAAVGMGGVLALVQQQLLPRIRSRAVESTELGRELSSRMTENIQGLRLLHTSGQLDVADQVVANQTRSVEINSRAQTKLNAVNAPIIVILPIVMIAAIAALSMVFFGDRNSGVLPSLVTFVVALQRLNGTFGNLSQTLVQLKNNSANLDVLNDFLNESDKQFRHRGGLTFSSIERNIQLRNVSLRYAPELEPALTDINLILPKGQTIALVGSSGAGKSSLADLLAGLYSPTEGEILVDGTNRASFDLVSWQQRLGVVSQDTFLFNASIAENIAFGTPGASRQAIEMAAEQAQASRFIQALPDGFETLVGERGYRLSGGQRQRLSLARAILRDPELLILDEATSALDSESERLVQQAIDRFERKHTVLVIAHRLSTIVNADLICVLDKGAISESGKHVELLAKDGRYAQLWKQQSTARTEKRLLAADRDRITN
jgi:ATP-binding cassette subfamily B protein/subfamily B ATP-binding cassette protein MsbA